MRPINWHIIDDESINALMAEALREARETSPAPKPENVVDAASDIHEEGIHEVSPDRRFRLRFPKPGIPSFGIVLSAVAYLLVPVLFLMFDTLAWSIFADVCNLTFGQGSGDIWAMQWIGWSQRHPIGLVGMLCLWGVCGGFIKIGVKGKNPVQHLKETIGHMGKTIRESRLPRVRTSQAGER